MTRATCPAAAFGCSCNRCVKAEPDLTALIRFNRATYATATFLILLAVLLGLMAVGLLRIEGAMQRAAIINQENIVITKGPTSWH
ncbi:hypothetical protein [Sinorhizobium meliloti]|uniref:hypothetical protein n=1 Tax=Rhizobium meliloti TaxID=382 RepID=UPI000B4A3179|nr:hypothetical protein [Sinorhizobium meliloti]ASP50922.1 hypothetical protein CDO31_04625 [Sinorhizobium meliloti]